MPPSGDGNGFGDALRRGLRAVRAARPHASPAVDRVGAHRARGRPARRRARSSTTSRCSTAARDAGVSPWVCLHHFTLPGWFTELGEGGFVDDRARSYYWARHVAFCAETFGDLVFGWKPINEPAAYAGIYPHGAASGSTCSARSLLAQRDAWRELRGGGKPVATIHNLSPVFTVANTVPADKMQAELEAMMLGRVDARRSRRRARAARARRRARSPTCARRATSIGFSYYSATGVDAEGEIVPYPADARVGPMGYAPWSEGLGDRAAPAARRAARPSAADLRARRRYRRRRVALRRVARVARARRATRSHDGVDVRGFFHWTGVDNYEWNHGFDVQFGCFTRDREPRGSAELLARTPRLSPRASRCSWPSVFSVRVRRRDVGALEADALGDDARRASAEREGDAAEADAEHRLEGRGDDQHGDQRVRPRAGTPASHATSAIGGERRADPLGEALGRAMAAERSAGSSASGLASDDRGRAARRWGRSLTRRAAGSPRRARQRQARAMYRVRRRTVNHQARTAAAVRKALSDDQVDPSARLDPLPAPRRSQERDLREGTLPSRQPPGAPTIAHRGGRGDALARTRIVTAVMRDSIARREVPPR